MTKQIEPFLQPVSAEAPCGIDLSYDPDFQQLETDIRGKPETQFGPAEEPEWPEMRERTLALLEKTKDLRLGVFLTLALLRLEGLSGFRDGLQVLRYFVEENWDQVYPLLDPEDPDPMQRANILSSLGMPVTTYQEPYRFIARLGDAPLCPSPKLGRPLVVSDLEKCRSGKGDLTMAQLEELYRGADPALQQQHRAAIDEAVEHIQGIDAFLMVTIIDSAPNFEELTKVLLGLQKFLHSGTGEATAPADGTAAATGDAITSAFTGTTATAKTSGGGALNTGAIESKQDVIRALGAICEYYRKHEPASPVPLLLQRAQRLVDKDFMAIIEDMASDAMAQVRVITGQKAE